MSLTLKPDFDKSIVVARSCLLVLTNLRVRSVKILTNNPDKIYRLEELGIIVESNMPLEIRPNKYNKNYLATKKNKMGHILKLVK